MTSFLFEQSSMAPIFHFEYPHFTDRSAQHRRSAITDERIDASVPVPSRCQLDADESIGSKAYERRERREEVFGSNLRAASFLLVCCVKRRNKWFGG